MTFGVTDSGFNKKLFGDVQAGMQAYLRAKISKRLKLTEKTGLGNVVNGASEELASVWEAAEGVYHAFDKDNADDASFVALAALTGTEQHGAKKGTWAATCGLQASKTFNPGDLVAQVAGEASNRWQNRDLVVTTTAGSYPVLFESQIASSAAVGEAGTLVIAQPIDGWTTVSTSVAASPGEDEETIEELAIRREQELQGSGSGPLEAIRARVSKVAGVLSVNAIQNVTNVPGVNGLPIKSYRIVIWDGVSPAALDNDVAAAILASGPAGIQAVGAQSGMAVDRNGKTQTRNFDRAAQLPVYVTCTVTGTANPADITAAILAKGALSGVDVIAAKVSAAITDVTGVDDLIDFKIGTTPSPTGSSNIPVDNVSIAVFDAARISVTLA